MTRGRRRPGVLKSTLCLFPVSPRSTDEGGVGTLQAFSVSGAPYSKQSSELEAASKCERTRPSGGDRIGPGREAVAFG